MFITIIEMCKISNVQIETPQSSTHVLSDDYFKINIDILEEQKILEAYDKIQQNKSRGSQLKSGIMVRCYENVTA